MVDTALDRFFEIEKDKYGKAAYYFKPDKTSSKIRAFYTRPFCPEYIQSFSTTMYPNTFFAEKKKGNTQSCLETEYHENVHKWDRWHEGFAFVLKYAWPHWMGLPFLLAVVALSGMWGWIAFAAFVGLIHLGLVILEISARRSKDGVASSGAAVPLYAFALFGLIALVFVSVRDGGYWALLWLGAALFFSPWPFKPFCRRNYEIRGYTMSLYRIWLKHKDDFDADKYKQAIDYYVDAFAGPAYFFMETNKTWVRQEFLFQIARIQFSESSFLDRWVWRDKLETPLLEEAEPFRMAKAFIEQEGFGG